jgi:hypothetical protein
LADIPVAHLSYHAHRYGKAAIGFHRDAAIREGFHPVFYTWHEAARPILAFHEQDIVCQAFQSDEEDCMNGGEQQSPAFERRDISKGP